jgi:type II secretory pathway pseudopilin PulG/fibronectin type 3 domain-containing protein
MFPTHATQHASAGQRRQAGLTLIEVLVAFTVFVVVAAAAFILFTRMRQSEKIGRQAVEQQQVLRSAFFDDFVSDLRRVGLNYNTTGNKLIPDEQIEGAWDGAIVFRADTDMADPVEAADPESVIQGPWQAVSIGNDEIIAYFLRKPDGTGGANVTFSADVNSASTVTSPGGDTVAERDNAVDSVTIPNVITTQSDPPYTLYRATLSNNAGDWGGADFVNVAPVADNIYSLQFIYKDAQGNAITAPGGAETTTAKQTRAQIRDIEIEIVGMTEVPDPNYTDVDDPITATQNYRKFTLASDVQPRNLGRTRVADIDLTPPGTPTNVQACAGHCQGMIVSWDARPVNEAVAEYRIKYGSDPANLSTTRETSRSWIFVPGLTDGTTYYFAVASKDASGNQSAYSSAVSQQCRDDVSPTLTTPTAVNEMSVEVSGGGGVPEEDGQITLKWSPVTQNLETLACDPQAPAIRDLTSYRVYRSETSPVSLGSVHAEPAENTLVDTQVVNCRTYFYQLTAVDSCGHESAALPYEAYGMATTEVAPEAPTALSASYTAPNTVDLQWAPVKQNVEGKEIFIATYNLYRQTLPAGQAPSVDQALLIGYVTDGSTQYRDTSAPVLLPDQEIWYWVKAADDCVNESAASNPAQAICAFTGTVTIDPPDGQLIPTGNVTITVSAAGDDFVGSQLVILDGAGVPVYEQNQSGPGPWLYNWTETTPGNYQARAIATTAAGCAGSAVANWKLLQLVSCANVEVTGVTSSNRGKQVIFTFLNRSSSPLLLQALEAAWTVDKAALGEVNVGPNPPVVYNPSAPSPVFVNVDPDVRVEALDGVQIIYDMTRDMTGSVMTTRFDFITVGINGSLRQCPIDFLVP